MLLLAAGVWFAGVLIGDDRVTLVGMLIAALGLAASLLLRLRERRGGDDRAADDAGPG